MTLLSLEGRHAPVRRARRRRCRRPRRGRGRRHRHHRPERRRQDHAVQPDLRLPGAGRRPDRVRRRRHHRPRAGGDRAPRAWSGPFSSCSCSENLTAIENVKVGCHLHTRGGLWSALFRTPGVRRRRGARSRRAPRELLAFVGLDMADRHRSERITYGQQRLLEIARALAARSAAASARRAGRWPFRRRDEAALGRRSAPSPTQRHDRAADRARHEAS